MVVYITDKLNKTSEMILHKDHKKRSFIDILKGYDPIEYDGVTDKDKFKKEKVRHFISGEIKPNEQGKYHINKTSLIGRDLVALDFDALPVTFEEFIEKTKSVLGAYKWIAYKTLSHSNKATYCRLIVELDGLANEWDYKATVKEIGLELTYIYDPMSETFTQRMAFPVKRVDDNDYKIIFNDGKPFEIVKGKPVRKEQNYYFSNEIGAIDDELALSMFKIYLELDRKELEYNFRNFFACVSRLARAVLTNEISYDVALECVDLLAYGNSRYLNSATNNQYYLNELLKRKDINSLSDYSFKAMIRVIISTNINTEKVKDLIKLYNGMKGLPTVYNFINYYDEIQDNKLNVKYCLSALYKEWVSENITYKKTGELIYPDIKPTEIGNIILKCVPMFFTGETIKTKVLYVYDYHEKRYMNDYDKIKTYVQWVYEHINPRYYDLVEKYLTGKVEFKTKSQLPNNKGLIPVKNGIFDKKNKKLLPFDYKYFITTKFPIKYNKNAKIPEYFNPHKWLNEIACGYEPTFKNLWEIISDVVDVNAEREGIHFLTGSGNNGKGTFIQLLKNLIGIENIGSLAPQDFSNRFDLSSLVGKVCNIGDDIPITTIEDPSKLKSVATQDFVPVEEKGRTKYTAEFNMSLLFTANKLPLVKDTTNGFYRRMNVIPFEADFNGKVENKAIKKEYIKDVEVLEYILKYALELDFDDFTFNPKSQAEKEKYKEDNDSIRSYVLNEYITNEYSEIVKVPQNFVLADIKEYWDRENIKAESKPTQTVIKTLNEIHPHRVYKLSEYPSKLKKKEQSIMADYGIGAQYTNTNSRYIILESDEKVELLRVVKD